MWCLLAEYEASGAYKGGTYKKAFTSRPQTCSHQVKEGWKCTVRNIEESGEKKDIPQVHETESIRG